MGTLVARWERGVGTGFLWAALSVAGCDGGTTAAPQPDASAVDAPNVGCASGERLCGARCVDPTSDPSNCGACGQVCSLTHVAAHACAASACAVVRCADGYGDCDGTAANGCETDLRVTASSCGACGHGCALPNATAACAGGACAVTTCATGFADCDMSPANGCEVDTRSDLASCGACGRACAAGAACTAGACVCPAGQRAVGTACVAADAAPRPIAPLSLGDVTQRRPTLRWALATGYDGAVVELCRDRACTAVIETLTATGSRARPTAELPARSVVFWRVRGRVGATTDTAYGPTWLFHVPATSASSEVDTSANPHLDVNGDGHDDVVASSLGASPGGRANAGAVRVFLGSATGVSATSVRVLEGAAEGDQFGYSVASAGDVNGDGYADLVVGASEADPGGRATAGTASVFLGSAMGVGASAARVLEGGAANDYFGWSVASAGDVNGDGYADVVVGAFQAAPGGRTQAGTASVFHGSATGVGATAARVLEGAAAGDLFGHSVAGAGDVNADGYADVVVGASNAQRGGRLSTGAVSVFQGTASGVGTTPAWALEGGAAFETLGWSVASADDLPRPGSPRPVHLPPPRMHSTPALPRRVA